MLATRFCLVPLSFVGVYFVKFWFNLDEQTVAGLDAIIFNSTTGTKSTTTTLTTVTENPTENLECKRQESIFFLKTSKTGSTTIANILYRFGFKYEKTFLFGEQENGGVFFENGYLPFNDQICYLGRDIKNREPIDISAIHLRYNKTAVDAIMNPNAKKISILRSPLDNFVSSWRYYNNLLTDLRIKMSSYDEENPNFIAEIKQFLLNPWFYLKDMDFANSAYLFLANPQFVFFGYPSYLLQLQEQKARALVDEWIRQIDEEFDMILILEQLTDSLALFVLKYCWDIRDVAHIKLNSMKVEKRQLSDQDIDRLSRFNWADYRLYKHFRGRLSRELSQYDPAVIEEVKFQIEEESRKLQDSCIKSRHRRASDSSDLRHVKVKNGMYRNQTCFMMTQQESVVTHAQIRQILRWKKKYPEWRIPVAQLGDDVPQFCTAPRRALPYLQTLAEDELDRWSGFWEFSRFPTNQYDIKPALSHDIAEYLENHSIKDLRSINYIFNKSNRTIVR